MAEFVAEDNRIDGKGLVNVHVVIPVDGFDLLIDFVGVLGREVLNRFQDADGCTQAEVGFVHHLLVSAEGYHAAAYLDVVGS